MKRLKKALVALEIVVLAYLFSPLLFVCEGYKLAYMMSGSMSPTLNVGDLVVVEPAREIKVGDLVVFKYENYTILHRVIWIGKEYVCTKGDRNTGTECFPANRILFKVLEVSLYNSRVAVRYPFFGYVPLILRGLVGGR